MELPENSNRSLVAVGSLMCTRRESSSGISFCEAFARSESAREP